MIKLNWWLSCQYFSLRCIFRFWIVLQGICFFVHYTFPNKHQRNFIQTKPQEIYNDLFYEQAVVDWTEIKTSWKSSKQWLFYRKESSPSLNHNPVNTVNTDYSLCPLWKLCALTDSRLDAADGVKNYPFELKTSNKLAHNWWFMHFKNT